MASEEMASVSRKRKRGSGTEAGPYVLQSLADDLPLTAESDEASEVVITCVEFWGRLKSPVIERNMLRPGRVMQVPQAL
jgi:hypothetical protein